MSETSSAKLSRREFLTRSAGAVALGTSLPALLAACGGGGGGGGGSLQKVDFLLDITPYGKHAMFYAPLELGYFKDEGLDVSISSTKGSADNVTKIAANAAKFGFADTTAAILGRAQGANVKEICMVHYKNLNCVTSFETDPVKVPKDMEGKKIGATTGDAPLALLPGLAKINDVDTSAIDIVTVEEPSKPAALAAGQIDAAMDFYTAFPAFEKVAGEKATKALAMLYADFGLDLYNNGIIATDDTLSNEPDLVRSFLRALVKGIVWTVENPDQATDILIKAQPGLSKDVAREQLQIAIDHLMVDEVRQHGVGPMDETKMKFTLDTVSNSYELARPVELNEIYTNDYVPEGQIPNV